MVWRRGLLVALGLGAALVSGAGVAQADSSGTGSAPNRSSESAHAVRQSRPAAATQRAAMRLTPPTPSDRREPRGLAGPAPRPPVQAPRPAAVPEPQPTPSDSTVTPYGVIGKWMLGRSGKPADWPSHPSMKLYQPINVIIIDATSTTAAESVQKVSAALTAAGFPAQPIHSTGYQGLIDGVVYGQQPTAPQEAFSNAHWLLANDHGRLFGPAPGRDSGYVWTASFSREQVGLYLLTPTHIYVSFNKARDAVRNALVARGATNLGLAAMDNALPGRTTTTGDHDGYAAVISVR